LPAYSEWSSSSAELQRQRGGSPTKQPFNQPPSKKRSAGTDAAPVTGDRLKHRHRGERSGFGTQHPWAEPDARNKGEFAESVKLRLIEAPFGTDEEGRRPRRKTCCRIADRLAGAALVAQDEPARRRP